MAQTNLSIRIDEDLKRSFNLFCDNVGITMTSAFCLFAKQVVLQQKIPFEIAADPFYGEKNMAFLREGIKQLNEGKGVVHELIEEDE